MKKILLQLDTDPRPSTFDRVVAIDSGADEIFSYGGVKPEDVEVLVHGLMFTRGPKDLKHSAIFIGGSDVEAGEALLKKVLKTFFGPVRTSVMLDSNGSNTTACAAVLAARKHVKLAESTVAILGGTGPVGRRAAQILAGEGAKIRLISRSKERAEQTCAAISQEVKLASLEPIAPTASRAGEGDWRDCCKGADVVLAAGAAGVRFLSTADRESLSAVKVFIDVNAVPPLGLEGIEPIDKRAEKNNAMCYGALGVGGAKMKIHKAAIETLFDSNDHLLDTAALYEIAQRVAG